MKLFKKNNKGFSLVELIVVVAIMAVLMAILIPTLVRHVEKTKIQKDESAISEIANAMTIALADEQFSKLSGKIIYTGGEIDIDDPDSTSTLKDADYLKEVAASVKDYTFTSSEYSSDSVTFSIADEKVTATIDNNGTAVNVVE